MDFTPLSPITQQYLTHTPPSATNPRPTKRNTVHWEKNDFDLSVKENAAPNYQKHSSPSAQKPGDSKPSQELALDFGDRKFRGQQRRPPLAAETFISPESLARPTDTETDTDLGDHDLVKAARQLDPNDNVFENHRKKQFQWVLSLPSSAAQNIDHQPLNNSLDTGARHIPGQDERRYFGCNLLTWTKSTGKEDQLPGDPEDKYLLLATPLDLKPHQSTTTSIEFTTHQFHILQRDTRNIDMAASQVMTTPSRTAGSPYRPSPLSITSATWSTAAEASEDSDNNTLTIEPCEMKAPLSTIEDSLEELDQLEEEIDAITSATSQMQIKDDEDKKKDVSAKPSRTSSVARKTSSMTQSAAKASGSVRSSVTNISRRSSVRNSVSLAEPGQDNELKPSKATGTLRKVARPASLAPPKPLQKTSKPPTVSTFELPGERVARELKEKKAARLSLQLDPQKVAETVTLPQRARSVRSSKPPTIPNFELPGERISRLKLERLAKKIEKDEKEALERRQFKARPLPSNAAPTIRSTFTSRQRQNTMGPQEQDKAFPVASGSSPKAGAAKRQSMSMTPSAARTASMMSASTVSSSARGRTSSIGSSQVSTRATSSSAGSVASGGKCSVVSTEEIQQQKARGRNIYTRDNGLGQTKEQEELKRKEAIKLAREKYAQMSRNTAVRGRERRQQRSSSTAEDGIATLMGA